MSPPIPSSAFSRQASAPLVSTPPRHILILPATPPRTISITSIGTSELPPPPSSNIFGATIAPTPQLLAANNRQSFFPNPAQLNSNYLGSYTNGFAGQCSTPERPLSSAGAQNDDDQTGSLNEPSYTPNRNKYGPPDDQGEQGGAAAAASSVESNSSDESGTPCPDELTYWVAYQEAKWSRSDTAVRSASNTPAKNRSLSDSTPANSSTRANSQAASPITDSQGKIEIVFRPPEGTRPGIIIDSHQAKHVNSNLFGTHRGKPGDRFNAGDSTWDGLFTILNYLMDLDECEIFNQPPSSPENIHLKEIVLDITNRRIPYNQIKISSSSFNAAINSWCFHLFPVLRKQ